MKYIFITGMGRSGTKFTANLLSNIMGARVCHEFIGDREFLLLSWYLGKDYTIPYLQKIKEQLESYTNNDWFIDVNSRLAYAVPELMQLFKPAKIFHLVKDPKKVIRSIYIRRDEKRTHVFPKEKNQIREYLEADKFKQVCMNWASTTNNLLAQDTQLINFEKVVGDFDYLNKNLLEPFAFKIPYETWEKSRRKKINKTRSRIYRYIYAKLKNKSFQSEQIPYYEHWGINKKQIFQTICGNLMRTTGYE